MTPQAFFRTILVHRRLILANALGLCVLTGVISLFLPKWYASRASILPPEEKGSEFSLLSAAIAQAPILANFASTGTPSEILVRILESRTVRERVVERNDLVADYRARDLEKAVAILASRTSISATPEGVVSIRVMARRPDQAAAIANTYLETLDEFNREKRMTGARRTRVFIEGRLNETEADLAEKENALRQMEEQYATVALEEQTKAAIDAASGLLSEIVSREVQLGVLRQELTPSHPAVVKLESELGQLRAQLNQMIAAKPARDSTALYVPFRDVPSIKMEALRLARDIELLNRLYVLLTEQYEQARIQEMRDAPTVQVLDPATPPVRRAKPRRTLLALAGLGLGLVGGVAMAFGAEGGRVVAKAGLDSSTSVRDDLRHIRLFLKHELTRDDRSERGG